MIAKLERTQSIAQQNKEHTQNPHDWSNNKSSTTEPLPWNEQRPKRLFGLNAFHWYHIFALVAVVVAVVVVVVVVVQELFSLDK